MACSASVDRLPEICSVWLEQHKPVGGAPRLDLDRGKMPLPHRNHDRRRNAILTIALCVQYQNGASHFDGRFDRKNRVAADYADVYNVIIQMATPSSDALARGNRHENR
jgi:hypothetical protein